jgi:tetratricopeptide (TPR) repeat protein
MGYAAALLAAGQKAEAIAETRRALHDEPTHPGTNWALGVVLYFDGDLDGASTQLRHTLELHPGFAPAENLLALIELRRDDIDAAVRVLGDYDSAAAGSGDRFATAPALVYAVAGDDAAAEHVRTDWERRAHRGWVPPTAMALLYTGLGERERALEWLRRGVDEGDAWTVLLPRDPSFIELRSDPRFQQLVDAVAARSASF